MGRAGREKVRFKKMLHCSMGEMLWCWRKVKFKGNPEKEIPNFPPRISINHDGKSNPRNRRGVRFWFKLRRYLLPHHEYNTLKCEVSHSPLKRTWNQDGAEAFSHGETYIKFNLVIWSPATSWKTPHAPTLNGDNCFVISRDMYLMSTVAKTQIISCVPKHFSSRSNVKAKPSKCRAGYYFSARKLRRKGSSGVLGLREHIPVTSE